MCFTIWYLTQISSTYQTLWELKFCIFDVQHISLNNTDYKQNVHQKYFISNELLRISTKRSQKRKKKHKMMNSTYYLQIDEWNLERMHHCYPKYRCTSPRYYLFTYTLYVKEQWNISSNKKVFNKKLYQFSKLNNIMLLSFY